jgi:CubicO group peptidase (beta-lactamase class C family)
MLQEIQVCAFALAVVSCVVTFTDASRASLQTLASQARPDRPATPPAIEARIKRVENGLLPPARIKGEPTSGMKLLDRMQFYKAPAVSIAVINDGRLEWARAYGTREGGGKVATTVTTVFQAASLSKPVTAMAALSLVQQGKLDLDADVNGSLKSWQVPESEFTKTQKVTLRRILSHTAGLTVPGFLGYAADAPLPTLTQILDGKPAANSQPVRVDMTPGSKFRYAGGGYVVLQQLLTDVTGKSFPNLLDQLVLKKLGMDHSSFLEPPPQLEDDMAAGHLPDGQVIKGGHYRYPELAPAGLWTTPTDLAKLVLEIQNSLHGKSEKVLSREMTQQMLTPQIENSGLGLFIDGTDRARRFSHSGSNVGFKSYLVGYFDSGQGAVVMTNSENGSQLLLEILRSIAAEYGWPDYRPKERVIAKIDPSIYDAYVGEYEVAPGLILTVTKEGDKLFSQSPGQPRSEMLPESETNFFLRDVDAQFTFIREDGQTVRVVIRRGTREFQARKIK